MTLAERWKAEGEARGEAKGRVEGQRIVLLRQLGLKFGELPASVTERVVNAPESDLARWSEAVLTAESLEAVFAA
ncbi:MAG TPA: DUF4351 domain-containing protein [Polyangiaceae bacterium]|nr:DUF4351 domain-containing protein [Polyangiaceae bacterium]